MNYLKSLCLLCILFWSAQLSAQALDSAVLISKDSVKIRGLVKINSPDSNAEFIEFQELGTNTFKLYRPHEIQGYEIVGESVYESHETEFGYRFLKYLVQGKASLLELAVPLRTIFFLKMAGEKAYVLRHEEIVVYQGEQAYNKTISYYKQAMKSKLTECDGMPARIDKIKNYKASELVNLFVFYNHCAGHGSSESRPKVTEYKRSYFLSGSTSINYLKDEFGSEKVTLPGVRLDWFSSKHKKAFYSVGYNWGPFFQVNQIFVKGKIIEPYGSFGVGWFYFYLGTGLKLNLSERVFFRLEASKALLFSDLSLVQGRPFCRFGSRAIRGALRGRSET